MLQMKHTIELSDAGLEALKLLALFAKAELNDIYEKCNDEDGDEDEVIDTIKNLISLRLKQDVEISTGTLLEFRLLIDDIIGEHK